MSAEPRGPSLLRLAAWGVFFLVLAAWSAQNVFHCAPASALVGRPSPEFEGEIAAGAGASGRDRVSLGSLRGRPVLLDFWASWCPPCRVSIPILGRVARRHEAEGLVTLGINVESDQPAAQVVRAHRALGVPFPSLHDASAAIRIAFEIDTLPTLVAIDRQGVVRRHEVGVPDEDELEAQVREMLAEGP